MKYYLIVGETSGELHASQLMQAIKQQDAGADFRFIGGERMQQVGGTLVKHYRTMAYMGFVPVLMHLNTIFANMAMVKHDITQWQPDVVILVDYAGFNLNIARYLHKHTHIPVFYYISPKIWAWKEWRIKNFKRDVDEMFCILPFETKFYQRHNYQVHYVGNPTADEIRLFKNSYHGNYISFCKAHQLDASRPVMALLAGSRQQEIKDNLPAMLRTAACYSLRYQIALACAPDISDEYYHRVINQARIKYKLVHLKVNFVHQATYELLLHSTAALVTSGTATLETALLGTPQVVCYKTPLPKFIRWAFNHIIKVPYISLVNLIENKEVVSELFADKFTVDNIKRELDSILPGGARRNQMLRQYAHLWQLLGNNSAPRNAAQQMVSLLKTKYGQNSSQQ